jgi:transposase
MHHKFLHVEESRVTEKLDVNEAMKSAEQYLKSGKLSMESKAIVSLLLAVIKMLLFRYGATSSNSSKPPSQDPNRQKKSKSKGKVKPGGQPGHKGATLGQVSVPDEIVVLEIDRRTLPPGKTYTQLQPEKRQVYEIEAQTTVIEYQSEVLVDEEGNIYRAPFPQKVKSHAQYGDTVKSFVVYLSVHQLLPYERIRELVFEQFGIEMSTGTIRNMIEQVFQALESFEKAAWSVLMNSSVNHFDETGMNVSGKNNWFHSISNIGWTLIFHHQKRGKEAIDEIGFLPRYQGIAVHDNWQSYFGYGCQHVLCNAHHLRELTRAFEDDGQKWAKEMFDLLTEANKQVIQNGGSLSPPDASKIEEKYDTILKSAQEECPLPEKIPGKRGRIAKGKSRCLLERLIERKAQTLRFMHEKEVPFTNNQAERDIRMSKVHQKVSGCFRSMEGAQRFCRIKSFFSTCRKQALSPLGELISILNGKESALTIQNP